MAATGYEGLLAYFGCGRVKRIYSKFEDGVMEMMKKTKNIGRDDPRRIIHSMKVGLAITLTSLFYYFKLFYDTFGASTIWAVITVVVVFEFSVGATLGKGLNRIIATLVGGALGYGTHFSAILCGDKGQPVLLGVIVFLVAATATLTRFFPSMKARYDYGILIFILTFSMVVVSSYREDEILKLASDRFLTIVIGTFISVSICIFVCPIWIGNDLHSLLVNNLQNLSIFLQGAISYMHSTASIPIFHRDIKSLNILLDDNYSAKISDFGTSRFVSCDQSHLTTKVLETFGYIDPEYFRSSQYTEKSDVYSFGVLMVELLTWKLPVTFAKNDDVNLLDYFISLERTNQLIEILDVAVAKEEMMEIINNVAALAISCLRPIGKERPTMKQVYLELEGLRKLQIRSRIIKESHSRTFSVHSFETSDDELPR